MLPSMDRGRWAWRNCRPFIWLTPFLRLYISTRSRIWSKLPWPGSVSFQEVPQLRLEIGFCSIALWGEQPQRGTESKMAARCLGDPLRVTSALEICFFFPTIGLPHKGNGT